MRKLLLQILFIHLPVFVFSTNILPNKDVAIFRNDTLLIWKEFSHLILKEIEKQPSFKKNDNPLKVNSYTAYWKISDTEISLIKVTNQNTLNWGNLKQSDSLDLKKSIW